MTLNGVMAVILRYVSELGYSFRAHCVKVHVRYLIRRCRKNIAENFNRRAWV